MFPLFARVASRYSMHFTALYYIELDWSTTRHATPKAAVDDRWSSMPEYLEAITSTGDPDGIHGSNTTVDAIENKQTHPALASGITTSPLAGSALTQQPSRCPAKCFVPLSSYRS